MNVRHILDQLDWFRDELLAQEPFLARIPDVQLSTPPLPDVPSLLERYQHLLDRESEYLATLGVTGEPFASDRIGDLVRVIAHLRAELLKALPSEGDPAWSAPDIPGHASLARWAFDITLADGDALRQVAERLHESALHLRHRGRSHGA
ncbi:MAG: hypothetical protein O2899_08805 [Bacteroidetes bacterium]|nr:hypothetical protein [Bacteroidota bacterium]